MTRFSQEFLAGRYEIGQAFIPVYVNFEKLQMLILYTASIDPALETLINLKAAL